jgi:hypothetical protein
MSTEPRKAFALALLLFLLFSPPSPSAAQNLPLETPPPSEERTEEQAAQDFGYGVGSILASVLYSPFKLTYAGLGLVTGGLGYVLSGGRGEVANSIIYPAVQGHYVITPEILKGEESVIFIGPPPLDEPQPEPLSSSPTASLR